jgi:hypothetical protein
MLAHGYLIVNGSREVCLFLIHVFDGLKLGSSSLTGEAFQKLTPSMWILKGSLQFAR